MFCPKCGSILLPKKEGSKKLLACSCGYKSTEIDQAKIKEPGAKKGRAVEVIEKKKKEPGAKKGREVKVKKKGEWKTLQKTGAKPQKCAHKIVFSGQLFQFSF